MKNISPKSPAAEILKVLWKRPHGKATSASGQTHGETLLSITAAGEKDDPC